MNPLSFVKPFIYLIIILVLVGGFFHVSNLKADLAISQANNSKLEEGIREQHELMESMRKDIESIKKVNEDLNRQREELQKDKDTLTAKFSKRDFGALAAEKPNVVERLVNRGTTNAIRCIELASGAPLTEEEKKANTPTEANRECPNLINPAYTSPN